MFNKKASAITIAPIVKIGVVVIIVIIVFVSTSKMYEPMIDKFVELFNKAKNMIKGWFGFSPSVPEERLEDKVIIFEKERKILLNDGNNNCVADLGDMGEFRLDFNEEEIPFERRAKIYSVAPVSISSKEMGLWPIYVSYFDSWRWSRNRNEWYLDYEYAYDWGELNQKQKGIILNLGKLNKKNGVEFLIELDETERESEFETLEIELVFGDWDSIDDLIPEQERSIFRIKQEESKETIYFRFIDEWEWTLDKPSYNPLSDEKLVWRGVDKINEGIFVSPVGKDISVSLEDYVNWRDSDAYMIPEDAAGTNYKLLGKSLQNKDFLGGEEILLNRNDRISPNIIGWKDGSNGDVFFLKELKDILERKCK